MSFCSFGSLLYGGEPHIIYTRRNLKESFLAKRTLPLSLPVTRRHGRSCGGSLAVVSRLRRGSARRGTRRRSRTAKPALSKVGRSRRAWCARSALTVSGVLSRNCGRLLFLLFRRRLLFLLGPRKNVDLDVRLTLKTATTIVPHASDDSRDDGDDTARDSGDENEIGRIVASFDFVDVRVAQTQCASGPFDLLRVASSLKVRTCLLEEIDDGVAVDKVGDAPRA